MRLSCLFLITFALAADPLGAVPPSDAAHPTDQTEKMDESTADGQADDPLSRFKFGGSIGISVDLSKGEPVEEAQLVNGLVRTTRTATARPRVLLEIHRPFRTFSKHNRAVRARTPGAREVMTTVNTAGWGVGPFVAVQSGGSSVIDGVAAGLMFSILRDANTGGDFNLGVGVMLDEKVKFLGDGVVDGKALPTGETEIRLKEKAAWSVVVVFSIGQ